jgi:hypothetical protein
VSGGGDEEKVGAGDAEACAGGEELWQGTKPRNNAKEQIQGTKAAEQSSGTNSGTKQRNKTAEQSSGTNQRNEGILVRSRRR